MNNTVEFKSDKFLPYLPDKAQVNPSRYGAELAYWLSEKLSEKEIVTSYPNQEDWGWYLDYILESGDEFMVACGNIDGTKNRWLCFVKPQKKGIFGKTKADMKNAKVLIEAMERILEEEPSVLEIEWSNEEY
jgi:hypothetical protein